MQHVFNSENRTATILYKRQHFFFQQRQQIAGNINKTKKNSFNDRHKKKF